MASGAPISPRRSGTILSVSPYNPAMYVVVYWVGLAVLVAWTAYSAYSAIIG